MTGYKLQNRILAALLVLGLIAPLWILVRRHGAEQRNRAVEIVLDYVEVEQVAGAANRPIAEVLASFKAAGATSVAVQEETIGDLIESGEAVLIPRQGAQTGSTLAEKAIWVTSPEVERRIYRRLVDLGYIQTPADQTTPTSSQQPETKTAPPPPQKPAPFGLYLFRVRPDGGGVFFPINTTVAHARSLPIGLSPEALATAKQMDMPVVARLVNYPGINSRAIDNVTQELAAAGVRTVIFGQDQVLGFRGLVPRTAEAFLKQRLLFGSIEFSKQKGDEKLAKLLDTSLIRVHSIPSAEMATLQEPAAIGRYSLAVRERGVRMCYVRFFDTSANDPVAVNTAYIKDITDNLKSSGFAIRSASPLLAPSVPLALLPLLAAMVAIGGMFLLTSLVRLKWYYTVIFTLLLCAIAAIMAVGGHTLGLKLLALLAAIIFPVAAAIRAGAGTPDAPKDMGFWSSSMKAAGRLICATAISAIGGLTVAALLSQQDFMVHIDQFAGVKLAHVMPMLLALLVFAGGIAWNPDSWAAQRERLRVNMNKSLSEPILVWQTVAAVAVLVLLAIAVARSGNDSGMGVSDAELRFRSLLDRLLMVRPRTKEFLIGHPILMLGAAAAILGRRKWAVPLIIFGTIGQISVLNTFCHIHTPIAASAIRGGVGLVIGIVFGLALYAIMRPFVLAEAVTPSPSSDSGTGEKSAASE